MSIPSIKRNKRQMYEVHIFIYINKAYTLHLYKLDETNNIYKI